MSLVCPNQRHTKTKTGQCKLKSPNLAFFNDIVVDTSPVNDVIQLFRLYFSVYVFAILYFKRLQTP